MARITSTCLFALLTGCLTPAGAAEQGGGQRKECSTADTLGKLSTQPGLIAALQRAFASNHCNSIVRVLGLMAHTTKKGGRKLEKDRPLDRQAAEQERLAATRDPEFAADLAGELQAETDPLRRQVIEAALLHEYGFYAARDQVIQRISLSE